jgi:hypothetical protein
MKQGLAGANDTYFITTGLACISAADQKWIFGDSKGQITNIGPIGAPCASTMNGAAVYSLAMSPDGHQCAVAVPAGVNLHGSPGLEMREIAIRSDIPATHICYSKSGSHL